MTPVRARPQRMVRVGGLRARAGRGWRHTAPPTFISTNHTIGDAAKIELNLEKKERRRTCPLPASKHCGAG